MFSSRYIRERQHATSKDHVTNGSVFDSWTVVGPYKRSCKRNGRENKIK